MTASTYASAPTALRVAFLGVLLFGAATPRAEAQVTCAGPGTDRTLPSGVTVLNTYYPGPALSGLVTVAAGATSIPVDAGGVRGTPAIAAGDLLLVIQMQGATINGTGENMVGGVYGDGAGGDDRMGALAGATLSAGRYEFAIAAGPAGATITVQSPLTNSYTHSSTVVDNGDGTGTGFLRYQVVRVAEFRDLTIPAAATLTALPWDGRSGGIVVVDASGNLALRGTIDVAAMGFRGGSPVIPAAVDNPQPAVRGEGLAGSPARTYGLPVTAGPVLTVAAGTLGYFAGDNGRGGPGNGGGCATAGGGGLGTFNDSGGGGGGGGGDGGAGSIGPIAGTPDTIPRGGAGFNDPARVFLGGGGGSGSVDDPAIVNGVSGQPGGGIIYVRAQTISGNGTMIADGRSGVTNLTTEGGGGGGGGGSIFVYTGSTTITPTLRARGGNGTSTLEDDDGGGGGGGGGHIVVATPGGTATVTVDVAGGTGGSSPTAGDGAAGVGGFQQVSIPPTSTTCPAPDTTIVTAEPNPTSDPTGDFTFSSTDPTATFECSVDGAAFSACPATFSTAMLADGPHTIAVRARSTTGTVDPTPATYAWTVDRVAPDTTIVTAEPDPTSDPTGDFTFSSPDPTATFECSVDGAAFAACPATFSTAALADGRHMLSVRAVDPAGNVDPTPAMYSWTVDRAAPDTTIVTAEPDPTSDPTGDFTFSSPDPAATFECSVDGGAFAACPATFSTSALADGPHTIAVRAVDPAGNVDPTPATYTWTVDSMPPDTVIVTAEPDPTSDPTGDFTFSSPDATAGFECSIDGGAFFTCPATFSTGPLADGRHTLSVRAVDRAGNVDPTPAMHTWTVDASAPDTVIVTAEPDPTNDPTGDFTFSSPDATATFECSIDGGAFMACPATFSTSALPEGRHTLAVRARDAGGNVDPTPAMHSWTVDTTAPDTVIVTSEPDPTTDPTGDFTFSSPDATATFECSVDGGAFAPCPATFSTSPLANGMHTLSVRAVDAAGNVDPTPAMHTWTVNAATFVAIDLPDDGSTTPDTTPTISGRGEPGATVVVTIDGTVVGMATVAADGTWSVTPTTPLTPGMHTAVATSTNAGGLIATDMTTFTVGMTGTVVDFRQPDGVTVSGPRPELSGTSEPGNTVEVTLDGTVIGTVVTDAEGNWSIVVPAALADGVHSVSVEATNGAGDTATDAGSFTVDADLPLVEIRTPVDQSHTRDTTPTIVGNATPGLLVLVIVDGRIVGSARADADGVWSIDVTMALAPGPHTVRAEVTDARGRTAVDSHDFVVDAMAPTIDILVPADGEKTNDTTPTLSGTATPLADVQVFVDGALVGTTTAAADGTWSVVPTTPLSEGTHTVRAVAEDAAGNTATDGSTFIIDTSTTVVIDNPADGSTVGVRPILRGTAEPGDTIAITLDGTLVGTVTAAADGSWSLMLMSDLAAGAHSVTAVATDDTGNMAMDTNLFTVDPGLLDTDGDGLLDTEECPSMPCRDSDMDGNPDFDDPDDDDDGLPTADECTLRPCQDSGGRPLTDYLDDDDDGDGIPTRTEAPGGMVRDTDADGLPDHRDTDDDQDSIPTAEEAPAGVPRDSDMDGAFDYIDPDDDDDTIPTARERADSMMAGDDVDMDDDPNWLDTDSDGVMGGDMTEGTGDGDGDGIPDYLDPDEPTDAGVRDGGGVDAGPRADASPDADVRPVGGGLAGGACGCAAAGSTRGGGATALLVLFGLALALRRRRTAR